MTCGKMFGIENQVLYWDSFQKRKKEKKIKERKYYIEISHCFMWYTVKWLHAIISNVMQNNNIILSEILCNFLRNKIIYIIDTWNQSK